MSLHHTLAVFGVLVSVGGACTTAQQGAGGSADETSEPAVDVPADVGDAPGDAGTSAPPPEEPVPGSSTEEEARSMPGPQLPLLLPAVDGLDETVVTITTAAGEQVRVDAKVAATAQQQRNGLMHVPDLPSGVGMLFVFADERSGGFWMFNTLVPLDIAYIDDDGVVGTILAMDPCGSDDPGDCPAYTPDRPYRAALEVPQGWYDDVGVATGDRVAWTEPVPAG